MKIIKIWSMLAIIISFMSVSAAFDYSLTFAQRARRVVKSEEIEEVETTTELKSERIGVPTELKPEDVGVPTELKLEDMVIPEGIGVPTELKSEEIGVPTKLKPEDMVMPEETGIPTTETGVPITEMAADVEGFFESRDCKIDFIIPQSSFILTAKPNEITNDTVEMECDVYFELPKDYDISPFASSIDLITSKLPAAFNSLQERLFMTSTLKKAIIFDYNIRIYVPMNSLQIENGEKMKIWNHSIRVER